jgi:hypothetical protein
MPYVTRINHVCVIDGIFRVYWNYTLIWQYNIFIDLIMLRCPTCLLLIMSGSHVCVLLVVERCAAPPVITHGNMTTIDMTYNTNITYTCEVNYRLEYGYKQLTIRCQEDGEWTYRALSCDCKYYH